MGARKRARHVNELTHAEGCCRSQHQNIKRLFSSTSRATGWRGADRRYDTDLQKGEEYRWQERGICAIH